MSQELSIEERNILLTIARDAIIAAADSLPKRTWILIP